jgi:cytosine/adenosine deaminase-related metal-dependent hydrolase
MIDILEEARAVSSTNASRDDSAVSSPRPVAGRCHARRTAPWVGPTVGSKSARADLVALDLASVRTAGGGATPENVVFAASAGDVTDVVVDGRTVVADRRHLHVPDVGRTLADAIAALWEAQ